MPLHDWSRVHPGTFHDCHLSWCCRLAEALNGGFLSENCYALTVDGASADGTRSVPATLLRPGPYFVLLSFLTPLSGCEVAASQASSCNRRFNSAPPAALAMMLGTGKPTGV